MAKEITGTTTSLDLSTISNGSYRIVLETPQGIVTKNIVKQ